MLEFGTGVLVGAFALPWYILAIFVIVCLADIGASYRDSYSAATAFLFIGVLLVSVIGYFSDGLNPLGWVWSNPVDALIGLAGYGVVGCLWSVAKWWLFLKKSFKRAEAHYEKKLSRYQANTKHYDEPERTRPDESYANENKGRLIGWAFHWPFSMLGVLLGDFILRLGDAMWSALKGTFERMATSRFKGYE